MFPLLAFVFLSAPSPCDRRDRLRVSMGGSDSLWISGGSSFGRNSPSRCSRWSGVGIV